MRAKIDREYAADATPSPGEGDAATFDAWTLEELDDDFGSLRSALRGEDEAIT